MSFITAGSLAWYGALLHLPKECRTNGYLDKNKHKSRTINSKLYRCEYREVCNIKDASKGGRVRPG